MIAWPAPNLNLAMHYFYTKNVVSSALGWMERWSHSNVIWISLRSEWYRGYLGGQFVRETRRTRRLNMIICKAKPYVVHCRFVSSLLQTHNIIPSSRLINHHWSPNLRLETIKSCSVHPKHQQSWTWMLHPLSQQSGDLSPLPFIRQTKTVPINVSRQCHRRLFLLRNASSYTALSTSHPSLKQWSIKSAPFTDRLITSIKWHWHPKTEFVYASGVLSW